MSKSDVEMEDPRELPNESGNNPQESKSKVFDAEIESKSEISPPAAAVLGDAKVRENGGDDLNKCNTELKNEVNDQINLKSEADKPMEGSVSGEIITKNDNEEQINTETKAAEQINTETKAAEQINTETKAEEQIDTDAKVEEQIDAEAKVEEQINAEAKVEEQINAGTKAEEKINTGTKAEEKINTGTNAEEQINSGTKADEQTAPISAVEKQIDAKSEVVEQKAGLEENKPSENGVESGNYQENVEKIPNEDIPVMKPKEIGQMEMYNAEPVLGGDLTMGNADAGDKTRENRQLPTELSSNEDRQRQEVQSDEVPQGKDEEMADAVNFDEEKTVKHKEQSVGTVLASGGTGRDERSAEIAAKHDGEESSLSKQVAKPELLSSCSSAKTVDNNGEMAISIFTQPTLHLTGEGDDGTPEEQTAFMKDLESFYRERGMDFKPPKFYGQPLNCLKLWRSVIRLGGYDRVTGSKLWRQVGESFHPPKTCTTVSWTFRIFYEKSILDFERHKTQSGELQLPVPMLPEVSGVDGEGNGYQGSGPGRARRDSASRAMQGWHAQRISDSGEVNNMAKHEKNIKSIGSHKQKRPNELEHSNKAARTELSKQLVSSVVDIGPPADWVKINVRQTKDCFEVYALVPGLLREEVRVQSDPAGRVVITGQPEQADNPWGITAFKKVVSLPARIDPLQTSAVVSLHGRLLVRVPYEQSNISN